ncbi:hypothetical protein [Kingella kingae]|uniref:hypothetical protein n=1 Tax=Kingella kingae TaxID=504 RepID=UPI002550B89E|nr:hypothetical protein [Kingella kingae]MDK4574778.1 hypothetical protein [Kingella kingae]MDK4606918.1 hypothetical protein [Kingella kingae]
MTYQSAINTFFLARFPAALMCLIVTPFWAKADDMDTTIFISLLILSSIAILWLFFRLPKKVLKYKGYSNYQIQRIAQYFDLLPNVTDTKYFTYFVIGLIILWILRFLVLNKLAVQPLDIQGVIMMLAGISARMLADYQHLKMRQKRKNYF